MEFVRFVVLWLAANVIGFVLGSRWGATDGGQITKTLDGFAGLVLGDLVFGACFGLAQWLVLRATRFVDVSAWWAVLSSLGFTLGARLGSLLTYRILDLHDALEPAFVFGIFMGGSIGLATYFSIRHPFDWKLMAGWVAVFVLAWVIGEDISFDSHFSQDVIPRVGLAIGGVTGAGLTALHLLRRKRFPFNGVSLTRSMDR